MVTTKNITLYKIVCNLYVRKYIKKNNNDSGPTFMLSPFS